MAVTLDSTFLSKTASSSSNSSGKGKAATRDMPVAIAEEDLVYNTL